MAAAEVAARPQGAPTPHEHLLSMPCRRAWWPLFRLHEANDDTTDRTTKRRPFASWVKRLTSLKGGDQNSKKQSNSLSSSKSKKGANAANTNVKNNPYPESGYAPRHTPPSSNDGFATPASHPQHDDGSIISGPTQDGDVQASNRSAAPTVATQAGTVHSDAGHSKAFTNTTGGGALSSIDVRGGNGSTFSSPNQSERSLTTTLTTIQSTSPANALQQTGTSGHNIHNQQPNGQPFSHQYPVSPAPSSMGIPLAIPRHLTDGQHNNSNVLTDDASILTLASSSKRRRRSMDTDASVRAMAPNSLWGGSRESLPLSVLSGTADGAASTTGLYAASQSRPSIGGLASAERASVYSSQGVSAPALASERNSYYAGPSRKDLSDAKSLRSITNLDARSQYDAKSINDARSMNADTRSLRNYEGSIRSGALGHGRNDSIPGSIGSPLTSPGMRLASGPGNSGALSRRSSDWREVAEGSEGEDEVEKAGDDAREHGMDPKV